MVSTIESPGIVEGFEVVDVKVRDGGGFRLADAGGNLVLEDNVAGKLRERVDIVRAFLSEMNRGDPHPKLAEREWLHHEGICTAAKCLQKSGLVVAQSENQNG